MIVSFRSETFSGDFKTSDDLAGFMAWLVANRTDTRVVSLITLLALHDNEKDSEERLNIRTTLNEILEQKPL